jgi:hypothetical protein
MSVDFSKAFLLSQLKLHKVQLQVFFLEPETSKVEVHFRKQGNGQGQVNSAKLGIKIAGN